MGKISKGCKYKKKNNNKKFTLLVALDKSKIGLEGKMEIEIVVLKNDNVPNVIDRKSTLEGYPINKKH